MTQLVSEKQSMKLIGILWSAIGIAMAGQNAAWAADLFPNRPVRIVVNAAPGGSLDVITRIAAKGMGEKLGQPVFIENRAGGDGALGARVVKMAPADGYTLLATAGTLTILPAVKLDPGYDVEKDFVGIGPMFRQPLLAIVGASQPDKTLADFVARAKANPGKLSYASAGSGTTTHIGAARFMHRAGLNLLHVPYKGNGPAMADVMAGRVDVIFGGYGGAGGQIKGGKLRALGVSTAGARLPELPDVPPISEQGFPDFSHYIWIGLVAPAGTPPHVVQRLSEALRSALTGKEFVERVRSDGSEVMLQSPEEFDRFLKRDILEMGKLVTTLGLQKQ
jgi:tripartite-type tricarboxylate transporter receptor subunit TctC